MISNAVALLVYFMEGLTNGKGATIGQLAERSGFHRKTVQNYIKLMHKREKNIIHICNWDRTTGKAITPIYAIGYCLPDVPKPASKSNREAQRDCRLAKKIRSGAGPKGVQDALKAKKAEITAAKRSVIAKHRVRHRGQFQPKQQPHLQETP